MGVIEDMDKVKKYDHLFAKARKMANIPQRQPILDYGFGGPYLPPEFYRELVNGLNLYNFGFDFTDRYHYWAQEVIKPTRERWLVVEEDGYWVAIDTKIPDWLKKVGEQRAQERKEIMDRKKLNN